MDEKKKLSALLSAWRKKKHPRIADLIDRVSEPLVEAAGGPVKAKSVPERTKLMLAMLRKKDPVDIGRVLATEWPGTWDPAMPLVRALVKLPEDPRVAQCFAKQVDLTQYISESAINLYRPLFKRLDQLADVRTKELLELQLPRAKNEYYARNSRKLEERSVANINKVKVPALTAAEEKWLTELEAPFASAKATKREQGKSGAELLAAVYANPTDLGLRAVYADWLAQHGDPRGELINLQLAPLTPKSEARIRSLIKKHWRDWVGPLADWFTSGYSRGTEIPEFKAGFMSRVLVQEPKREAEGALRKLLERPEWRTVETIVSWPDDLVPFAELFQHPNFQQVRELKSALFEKQLLLLGKAGAKHLEAIEVWFRDDDEPETRAPGFFDTLPALKRVTISGRMEHPRSLEKLAKRLELFVLEHADETEDAAWKWLEDSGVPRVRTNTFDLWRANGSKHFNQLERSVDSLTDAEKKVMKLFPKVKRVTTGPLFVSVNIKAPLRDEKSIAAMLSVLATHFGVTFDSFSLGKVLRELGDDPVARLLVHCSNQKNYYVDAKQRNGKAHVSLWHRNSDFSLPYIPADKFIAGVRALCALVPPETEVEVGANDSGVDGTAKSLARVEKFIRAL